MNSLSEPEIEAIPEVCKTLSRRGTIFKSWRYASRCLGNHFDEAKREAELVSARVSHITARGIWEKTRSHVEWNGRRVPKDLLGCPPPSEETQGMWARTTPYENHEPWVPEDKLDEIVIDGGVE